MKNRLALLMTHGSPLGLRYLEAMLEMGFAPTIIIASRTPKITDMAVSTVKARTKNTFTWKSTDELLANKNIPLFFVDSHNSEATHQLLKTYKIDLGILGGTGIIKAPTIAVPKKGIINTHPGLLPNYRGCSAVEWSLYNNDPIGAACHFVTPEIDAGDIVTSLTATIIRGDDYFVVRRKAYELQVAVLLKGLKLLEKPDFKKRLQKNQGGAYYDPIDPKKLTIAKQRLTKRTYKQYAK